MKIDIQPREDHQVILTVEVEPQILEDAKARAARHISKHTKIPGFRPGKAPLAVVQRTVGAEAILEEAVELLINDVYPKALDESGIEPYGPGSLENVKSMTPPVFEFIVPLRAEVELGDFQSIRLPYELSEIRDEEVENVISGLLEQQAVVEPVERKAQEGDLIYLHLDAHRKQPKEGESQTIIDNRAIPVVVLKEDDDSSNDWPFPGFSRKLIDLSSGEEVSFEYDFPEDAANESLQGVKADFHVSVDAVNSRTLPELNDEFAQSVGDFPTLDSLRSQIRKNLEEQNLEMYHETYDEDLLEKVVEMSSIKYPPQMLEHEIDHLIQHLKERLERQRLDMDLYLKSRQMDLDGLREELKPVAEARIKKSLVLFDVADQLKINVSPDDLQAETERTLGDFSRIMPEKEFRKMVASQEERSDLIGNIMMDMIIVRAKEQLRDIARGLEPKPSDQLQETDDTEKPAAEVESENASSETVDGEDEENN